MRNSSLYSVFMCEVGRPGETFAIHVQCSSADKMDILEMIDSIRSIIIPRTRHFMQDVNSRRFKA